MGCTNLVAKLCCGGSHRKLIAGLWYIIILLSLIFALGSFYILTSRSGSESLVSLWATTVLISLTVGGTITMRSFHSSMAIGFFVGAIVGASQLFFLLFWIYIVYADERMEDNDSDGQERVTSIFCLILSVVFGSFAYILGTHRGEVLTEASQTLSVVNAVKHDSSVMT